MSQQSVPRIEYLKVQNYRALHHIELKNITPLTAFLGPNGSGKSTIFDVFAFLSECFTGGLGKAWDKRGRFRELRTRAKRAVLSSNLNIEKHLNLLSLPIISPLMKAIIVPMSLKNGYIGEENERAHPSAFLILKMVQDMLLAGRCLMMKMSA